MNNAESELSRYWYEKGYNDALNNVDTEKYYQQGRADEIEPIKAIIEKSEKMMWHSDKTLEKIKEQLRGR